MLIERLCPQTMALLFQRFIFLLFENEMEQSRSNVETQCPIFALLLHRIVADQLQNHALLDFYDPF